MLGRQTRSARRRRPRTQPQQVRGTPMSRAPREPRACAAVSGARCARSPRAVPSCHSGPRRRAPARASRARNCAEPVLSAPPRRLGASRPLRASALDCRQLRRAPAACTARQAASRCLLRARVALWCRVCAPRGDSLVLHAAPTRRTYAGALRWLAAARKGGIPHARRLGASAVAITVRAPARAAVTVSPRPQSAPGVAGSTQRGAGTPADRQTR